MKTNLHIRFGSDRDTAEEGVWRDVLPGIRMKLASVESRRYKQALLEGHSRRQDDDGLDIVTYGLAHGVIREWVGVTAENGEPLACTPETAYALLSDPELWVVRERVAAEASFLGAYRKEAIDNAAKN